MVFSAGEQAAADFWKTLVERSYLLTLISENTTASDEAAIEQEKGSKNELDELDELDEMDETVSESPSVKLQKKIVQALRFKHVGMKDFLYSLKMGAFGQISKAFGNTVGMVQFRKGKLYHRKDVEADISSNLKPGDILLERTPFRLTDFFIPGYFGHAAIWMGTEAELKELGIWEHPTIVPLHDKIRSGASIVQALRPGTIISPVMDFLDIDDFAVIRKRDPLSREELKDALIATATQVGKKYDFNFDVATQNTLVCSELVYIAYMKIEWRTEKSMGRNTINPDAVAERGEPGKEFDVIHLYVGGMKQTGDLSAKMKYVLDHAKQKDKKILHGLGSIE